MKLSLAVLATLFSVSAFAADSAPRNETRSRIIGENLIQVGQCEAPSVSTYEYSEPIVKNDGSLSQTKDGQIRYHKITKITASSRLKLLKCQVQEQYMVQVTGSFWNSKESEIPNSARRFGAAAAQEQSFTKSQDLDFQKLGQAAGDGGLFSSGSGAQMVLTISEGLKSQAKSDCEQTLAQLRSVVVAKESTECK